MAFVVVVVVASCGNRDRAQPPPNHEPPKVAAPVRPDAPRTPTCEEAADITLRLAVRLFPQMGASTNDAEGRAGVIDQCRIHPWDDEERRCLATVESIANNDDAIGALADCHLAGDCRRHPEYKACPPN